MYHIIVVFLLVIATLLPIGAIAGDVTEQALYPQHTLNDRYERFDIKNRRTYEIDGNSMKHLGFQDGMLVEVVPVSKVKIGDTIAFTCLDESCDGDYIKELTKQKGTCYWFEGRKDIWKEDNLKKQSMDSRTTYGWLCDDEVKILGVAFLPNI